MPLKRSDTRFPLWQSSYGWRARIGVVYPGSGFLHISDFRKLAPEGVALGACGVPRHKDDSAEEMMKLDEHMLDAARIVAGNKPDVISWMCTAGSFIKGPGYDKKLVADMEAATGIRCSTTSTAIMDAFRALGMKRIAMATPYPLDVNEIEKRFLEGNGFEVVSCDGLDLVDNNIITHLSPVVAYRLGKAVDVPEADGLFISCTGFDVLDVIDLLESDLQKPVVTSNQASFWQAFRMAGIHDKVPGYGKLFTV
jgi:maleate cis-trans isomerase